ncbi:MAG TPA: hypothetical protein VGG84_16100 [Gemmatimonadaceae bacterium]
MVVSLDASDGVVRWLTWRARLAAGAAVLAWLALAAVIASSYLGHSNSPYGVCYNAAGRSVPCAAAAARR